MTEVRYQKAELSMPLEILMYVIRTKVTRRKSSDTIKTEKQ